MTKRKEIIESFNLSIENLIEDYASLLGDVADSEGSPRLKLNIDATHSGRLTNDRVYPGLIVRDSTKTFIKPKGKPVLKNHDSYADPIGRVTDARFIQLKQGKAFEEDFKRPSEGPGSGLVQLDLEIMDFDSIEKFLDGRFQEFSTRQAFDGLFCSMCGTDFTQTYCGHYPGETVTVESKRKGVKDKQYKVFGITGPLTYREVSVVNIPADKFTNINEMKMSEDSLNEDWLISFKDESPHDISQLSLTSSLSDTSIDLLSSGKRQSVTAKDRETLTGKTIIAMAGPNFESKLNLMDKNKDKEINDEDVEDLNNDEETQNTDTTASSKDGDASKSNQDSTEDGEGEGVAAPETKTEDKTDETTVSDEDVAEASLKALATVNKGLEDKLKELNLELERVKGEATAKDEEIERLRESATEFQTKLKETTARQLLDNKLTLGKPDVSKITNAETYSEKLAELSKRTLESLNDALQDLVPELTQYKPVKSTSKLTDKVVENPVLDGTPKGDSTEDKGEKLTPMQKRSKHVQTYL